MEENSTPETGSLTPAVAPAQDSYRIPSLARTSPSKVAAVLAMDSLGVPKGEIARREGMGKQTVYQIIRQGEHMFPEIVDRVKKHLSAHYWISAERSLQHITDEKLKKTSANALMWTAGVATDKALLLEGKPTSRIEHINADDAETSEKIRVLEDELAGWKDGSTINVEGALDGAEGLGSTE